MGQNHEHFQLVLTALAHTRCRIKYVPCHVNCSVVVVLLILLLRLILSIRMPKILNGWQ